MPITSYAWLQIFIQLPATLTKLCHGKRNHQVHTTKCSPSDEMHAAAGIFWHFSQAIFSLHFIRLLPVPIPRLQIFIQLTPTVTKLCHIKYDHPACISADGGHFEQMMVVALNMA